MTESLYRADKIIFLFEVCRSPSTIPKKAVMAKHNAIVTSAVTSPLSPHLTSRCPTDDDEPDEMAVMFMNWHSAAINLFLEKWGNTNFGTTPPFSRPNDVEELKRRILEHLTRNCIGASVTSDASVDCNAPASFLLTAAMAHLEKEQWVRAILAAQPAGWHSTLGAIKVAQNGKTVHVTLGDNLMFN